MIRTEVKNMSSVSTKQGHEKFVFEKGTQEENNPFSRVARKCFIRGNAVPERDQKAFDIRISNTAILLFRTFKAGGSKFKMYLNSIPYFRFSNVYLPVLFFLFNFHSCPWRELVFVHS